MIFIFLFTYKVYSSSIGINVHLLVLFKGITFNWLEYHFSIKNKFKSFDSRYERNVHYDITAPVFPLDID